MPLNLVKFNKIPGTIPVDMDSVVEKLKQLGSQEECLRIAYSVLNKKYHGSRVKTYLLLWRVLDADLEKLWGRKGYLHCTNINYVLQVLLVKSGLFMASDIRFRWTLIWYISLHQYIQVKVKGSWVNVDIWASRFGVEFGGYAHGFK